MKEGKLFKALYLWAPVLAWASVIFMFSTLPTAKTSQFFLADFLVKKTAHLTEYGIFATLLYRALKEYGIDKRRAGYYAIVLAIGYAVTDEFHQSFTPGREPTLRDVIIDTIGASIAICTIWKLLPKAPKRLKDLAKSWQIL